MFGTCLENVGTFLDFLGTCLGTFWEHLGTFWEHVGTCLEKLGKFWENVRKPGKTTANQKKHLEQLTKTTKNGKPENQIFKNQQNSSYLNNY